VSEPIWTPERHRETAFSRTVALDVEPHESKAFTTPDGRTMQDCKITLTVEAAERMWQGYACARCLEGADPRYPLPERNPKRCPCCGFEIERLQRVLLERDFTGHDPDMVGALPVEREMEYLERKHFAPKGLVSVSRDISSDGPPTLPAEEG